MKISIKPLDKLFSEFIRKRAIKRVGGCERCLSMKFDIVKEGGSIFSGWKQLDCSHFYSRGRRSTRFNEDNCSGLCGGCHFYFDSHHEEYEAWMKERLGEERFNLLTIQANTPMKPDIEALTLYFQEKLGELKIRMG